jgi:hypothetical protein
MGARLVRAAVRTIDVCLFCHIQTEGQWERLFSKAEFDLLGLRR